MDDVSHAKVVNVPPLSQGSLDVGIRDVVVPSPSFGDQRKMTENPFPDFDFGDTDSSDGSQPQLPFRSSYGVGTIGLHTWDDDAPDSFRRNADEAVWDSSSMISSSSDSRSTAREPMDAPFYSGDDFNAIPIS